MAKRKKKKTRADKEAEARGAKKIAKLAEKETTAHKPTEAKAKTKAKPKTKSKSNIPAVIESSLEQIDKPVDISKEVDIGKPDSEILTENLEALQTGDQIGDVTEAILEADTETERLEEEAEGLQAEDEQTDIIVEAEDSDTAESLSQKTEETQTDKLVDDVSGSIAAQIPTEKIDDTMTGDQPGDVIEDPDTIKSRIEKADDNQADEAIEVVAEVERLTEEVGGLQAEDEQTDIIVEAEAPDTAESLSKETEETRTYKPVDDVSGSVVEDTVDAGSLTEEIDDTKTDDLPGDVNEDPDAIERSMEKADDIQTDNQAGEVTEEEAESKSIVDRVKKFLSGIFQIGSKADDSTEEG